MSEHGWNYPDDLLEAAWGLIANSRNWDDDEGSPEWREAAVDWRNAYSLEIARGPEAVS